MQERFIGGSLAKDFESGLLTRILRRASALLGLPTEKESATPHMDGNGPEYDLKRDQELRVRFNLAEGYSIWAGAGQVTCQPFGEETYEVLTLITDRDGTEIRIMVEESVHYCPHPVKAEYHIHDQGDTMRSSDPFRTQISSDLKLRIEKILSEYGVCADLEASSPSIFVKTDSQLIGDAVTRMARVVRAISDLLAEESKHV